MAIIALIGTLDTKGEDYAFVAKQVRARGHEPLLIDVGTLGSPQVTPNITREQVLEAAGIGQAEWPRADDRGQAVAVMTKAAAICVRELQDRGELDAVFALGGSGGTAIATAAMRALPIGVPKVMLSTMASGDTASYVGVKDIVMIPSIVDVAGLNRVSRQVYAQGVGAVCGMIETTVPESNDRPLIVASMFGNTTDCVQAAKKILEEAGYEVLVFHSTGTGGRAMDSLIEAGMVTGVLDVTTTEWADELVGGVLNAGPERLEAAAKHGIPAVIAPGCLDMVNFRGPNTIPKRFEGRVFYEHNPQITLMRTSVEESQQLGRILAEKINASKGPVTVLFPKRGLSALGQTGQPFHDPDADAALLESIRSHMNEAIPVCVLPLSINDSAFAEACAQALLDQLG